MSSTLPLLRSIVFALLVVVGLPRCAQASFIDPFSQTYRIHAHGLAYSTEGITEQVVDYDVTSGTPPIQRTDQVNGSTGAFWLSTSADGGITSASAFVKARSSAEDLGNALAGPAEASAAITFRPLVSGVVVQTFPFFSYDIIHGDIGLYDETAGAALLALGGFRTPALYNFSLDLEHLYTIYAHAPPAFGNGQFSAGLSIAPVPESEGTLTFFVVGLGALLIIARSHKLHPSN